MADAAATLSLREQRILRLDPLNQLLLVKEAELDLSEWSNQRDLAEWMRLAGRVVEQIEVATEDRGFLYLQDTTSLMMSGLALNLYRVYERQPESGVLSESVRDLLRRLHTVSVTLSHGHYEEAPAYVARFVQRILRAMTITLSRPQSPLASPRNRDGDGGDVPALAGPEFDLVSAPQTRKLTRQIEFLGGANALVPENLESENEYW